MNVERKCEGCKQPMRKIGPYATRKPEGQPSKKLDGKVRFQCTQNECPNFNQIIELDPIDREDYSERVKKVCECGHARLLHGNGFSIVQSGESFPNKEKDCGCDAPSCNCKKYESTEPESSIKSE